MLNLKATNSHYIFDSSGMLVVRGDDKSFRDSVGRTVLAWIAYGFPEELAIALTQCWDPDLHVVYRHPSTTDEKDEASRDHYSYWIIFLKLYCGGNTPLLKYMPGMRGMTLWMKSLTGNKRAEWMYYTLAIPGAYIGNAWLRFCRWAGRINRERENDFWIHSKLKFSKETLGEYIQLTRTRRQKLWGWIILNTIPAFALHIKAWQLYVMPEHNKRKKLQQILLKRVSKSNILVRLLLGDTTVSETDVSQYPDLTGYRPGVYLDESCRRDIREMDEIESSANTYEKQLILMLYENSNSNN